MRAFLAVAASPPCSLEGEPALLLHRSEQLLMMLVIVVLSRFAFFSSRWKAQREHDRKPCQGQINENEMEISGRLRGQMGEHDEMKKNSLTLFCLLKLCSTDQNTNKISMNASFRFHLFFNHKEGIK